jgi:hypothetical protein
MHGVKVLIFVAVAALVVATGVFWFVPKARPGFVKSLFWKMQGYTPAKTPQECLDRFQKAMKQRDYEAAALYADKDYAEQIRRGADNAKDLGDAIDSLRHNMKNKGITSEKVDVVLRLLDPFPAQQLKWSNLRESADKTTAVFEWDEPLPKIDSSLPTWINRHEVTSAFLSVPVVDWDGVVHLVKENDNWKIHLLVTDRMRTAVGKLRDKGGNYKNSIQVVRDEVKNNPATQENVESALHQRIDEAIGR